MNSELELEQQYEKLLAESLALLHRAAHIARATQGKCIVATPRLLKIADAIPREVVAALCQLGAEGLREWAVGVQIDGAGRTVDRHGIPVDTPEPSILAPEVWGTAPGGERRCWCRRGAEDFDTSEGWSADGELCPLHAGSGRAKGEG